MHRSVLQNKKYIKFAYQNTVEVMAVGSVPGTNTGDDRTETYKTKDEAGNEVEYMAEWPGLTFKDLQKLNGSKAGSYNRTGRIPYTAIVDPHTEAEMTGLRGGKSAGGLMDAVLAAKKQLEKEHGKSISRKTLDKIKKDEGKIRKVLANGKVADAITKYRALERKVARQPAAVRNTITPLLDEIFKVAERQLGEAERMIDNGQGRKVSSTVRALARALKDTPLEERAAKLAARIKGA